MASGTQKKIVVIESGAVSTGELQPNTGSDVNVPINIPQNMTILMASVSENTGANLFPVWIYRIDKTNNYVIVKCMNSRTTAYTGSISVTVLCE